MEARMAPLGMFGGVHGGTPMLLGEYRNLLPAEGNEGDSGLLQCSCSRPKRNGLKCWHEHFASYIAAVFPTVKEIGKGQRDHYYPEMQRGSAISLGRRQLQN